MDNHISDDCICLHSRSFAAFQMLLESFLGEIKKLRIDFKSNTRSPKPLTDNPGSACPHKRIENSAAGRASAQDNFFNQLFGKGCGMRARQRLRIDCPDIAGVFWLTVCANHFHRVKVKEILFLQDKMKNVLVGIIETISHTGGNSVWFLPDDIVAEKPAALLHFNRKA